MRATMLLFLAGLAIVSGKASTTTKASTEDALLAALAEQAVQASNELASGSRLPVSSILPSAVGNVTLTDALKAEYGRQSLAPIKYGPRPSHEELTLGLLTPCCGTCWSGRLRGYCSFWWTGCGWGRPLYFAHGCCGSYCTCCFYGHVFHPHWLTSISDTGIAGGIGIDSS